MEYNDAGFGRQGKGNRIVQNNLSVGKGLGKFNLVPDSECGWKRWDLGKWYKRKL